MKKFFTIFMLIPQLVLAGGWCTVVSLPNFEAREKGNINAPEVLASGGFKLIEEADYLFTGTVEDIKCLESSEQETELLNKEFSTKQSVYYKHNVTFKMYKIWKWADKENIDNVISLNFVLRGTSNLCHKTFKAEGKNNYQPFDFQKGNAYLVSAYGSADKYGLGNLYMSYELDASCDLSQKIEDIKYDLKELGKPIKEFNEEIKND